MHRLTTMQSHDIDIYQFVYEFLTLLYMAVYSRSYMLYIASYCTTKPLECQLSVSIAGTEDSVYITDTPRSWPRLILFMDLVQLVQLTYEIIRLLVYLRSQEFPFTPILVRALHNYRLIYHYTESCSGELIYYNIYLYVYLDMGPGSLIIQPCKPSPGSTRRIQISRHRDLD